MNSFKKNQINQNKIITLVNVGSYKVRVAICSFSFSGVKILGYGEKRQSRLDILNNEINNLSGLCETIKEAILKAELNSGEKSNSIVINPFFTNTFYYSKTISYKNTNNIEELGNKDIFKIISNIKKISISSISREIENKYGLGKDDLNLILTNISSVLIDGKKVNSLYRQSGEDIRIKILNAFIPKVNYEIINNISKYLEKDIFKIIPEEYTIIKLGNKEVSEVFIDIGNFSTSVSIKNLDDSLLGALRLDIGIGDLIKDISKNGGRGRSEIIKKLTIDELFREEKSNFLTYFLDILVEGLKEILGGQVCPENFILVGGGANNLFIKEYLSQIDFNLFGVKMLGKINFVSASIDEIKKIGSVEDILKVSNVNIISQIIATRNIITCENDIMEKALQQSI